MAYIGETTTLEVVRVSKIGLFLDGGDLGEVLLPNNELGTDRFREGDLIDIFLYCDSEDRPIATQRVDQFLGKEAPQYEIGQEVGIIIHGITDLGYKAVVDGAHSGLLFQNEVFRKLRHADQIKAYVKDIRSDWKIDLSLYPPGRSGVETLEERILAELEKRGGYWEIDDSTSADDIHRELGVSKKVFKKATGSLFKARKITFERPGIRRQP